MGLYLILHLLCIYSVIIIAVNEGQYGALFLPSFDLDTYLAKRNMPCIRNRLINYIE